MITIPAKVYEDNRQYLWALCYRMTGNSADADDLVQETFVRALEHKPSNDEPLRPWLVKVALNLSKDSLRRRKRRKYVGVWLPSPVPTQEDNFPAAFELLQSKKEDSPATRYDQLESISFAFLLALEALSLTQRAVLLLRDVFDYSTEETAQALNLTVANVKVTLLRARKIIQEYDKSRLPMIVRQQTAEKALEQFISCIVTNDIAGLEQLLAADVVSINDGGGEVLAAIRPVFGRRNVLRLIMALSTKFMEVSIVSVRNLNGLPTLVSELTVSVPKIAPRTALQVVVNEAGQITHFYSVLAPSKLNLLASDKIN